MAYVFTLKPNEGLFGITPRAYNNIDYKSDIGKKYREKLKGYYNSMTPSKQNKYRKLLELGLSPGFNSASDVMGSSLVL